MAQAGAILILDVGKTLSKLSLWSADGILLDKISRPNALVKADGVAVLDAEGIEQWVREHLPRMAAIAPVSAIIPVAHGAGFAAIRDGKLAFAPLDYEQEIPAAVLAEYREQRDSFAETGSPALPMGLNIGSQLHWAGDTLNEATLLPWAQYWSWFLSGVATSEVTSLGCHSDLWNPAKGDFSALAKRRGWASAFAPMAKAGDVIGRLKTDFGLGGKVNVHCGIHDSNAALVAARGFAEIDAQESTVLSTGTWFIAMRSPGSPVDLSALPEARDCLVNVDAYGTPVPSARFMGGREIELLGTRIDLPEDQLAIVSAIPEVLLSNSMILPGFATGCGPFPDCEGQWLGKPEGTAQQAATIALYAALMTDVSLELIGAKGCLLIEGRFAQCIAFTRALASLRPDMHVYAAIDGADVSLGALRLIHPHIHPEMPPVRVKPLGLDIATYKAHWRKARGRP